MQGNFISHFCSDKGGSHLGLPTASCTLGQAETQRRRYRYRYGYRYVWTRCSCMWFKAHLLHARALCVYISRLGRKSKSRQENRFPPAYLNEKYLLLLQAETRWDRLSVRYAEGATGMRQISGADCDFLATSATFHRSLKLTKKYTSPYIYVWFGFF